VWSRFADQRIIFGLASINRFHNHYIRDYKKMSLSGKELVSVRLMKCVDGDVDNMYNNYNKVSPSIGIRQYLEVARRNAP